MQSKQEILQGPNCHDCLGCCLHNLSYPQIETKKAYKRQLHVWRMEKVKKIIWVPRTWVQRDLLSCYWWRLKPLPLQPLRSCWYPQVHPYSFWLHHLLHLHLRLKEKDRVPHGKFRANLERAPVPTSPRLRKDERAEVEQEPNDNQHQKRHRVLQRDHKIDPKPIRECGWCWDWHEENGRQRSKRPRGNGNQSQAHAG